MRLRFFIFTISLILSHSACEEDAPSPDLEDISRKRCAIIKLCDPYNFDELWADLEACEAYSAEAFSSAKIMDKPCFDARLAWETCESMVEDCSGYDENCGEEYIEYFKKCEIPK